MKRFAYRQIIFQMVTKLSNLSPAFGKHAANQIPRNESGSVCSAAIFSETSAPFLMRGVFSIPQKSRAVKRPGLNIFSIKNRSFLPQKQPYAPRSERHCASAHTAAVQPNTRHGIRFSGSARSTSAPAAAKAKAKKKPERSSPTPKMDGEKPMAP